MEALHPGPQPACEVSHRGSDRGVPRQRTPPTDGVSVRLPTDRPLPERGLARADFARRGPFSPWPGVPESIPCHRIFPEGVPMRVRLAAVALSLVLSSTALAVTVVTAPSGPSKMLTEPALSAERIAFVYGNDIWTCRLDGSDVNRVTSGPGVTRL